VLTEPGYGNYACRASLARATSAERGVAVLEWIAPNAPKRLFCAVHARIRALAA
jgi:hypothetical protein